MTTHRVYDYYVVATRLGERPERWSWEIRRRSLPFRDND